MKTSLLQVTPAGLYCPPGRFHIDPWEPVERALITHAHSDHARPGSRSYLTVAAGAALARIRLGNDIDLNTVDYGQVLTIDGVQVSFHPAGHVLGSAQIRLEYRGAVCVISGDYKLDPDPTCSPFEPIRCHTFVTESTFGLPCYRWNVPAVFEQINTWWRANRDAGKASLLFAYALGKSQRVLANVDASIGPIYTHGAVERIVRVYRDGGIKLPVTTHSGTMPKGQRWEGSLIIAPFSARGSVWSRKFAPLSTGLASGWMRVRGQKRRRAIDVGFALSDHADWTGLNAAVRATGAEEVLVTHGTAAPFAQWLTEQGIEASAIATRFGVEEEDSTLLEGDQT